MNSKEGTPAPTVQAEKSTGDAPAATQDAHAKDNTTNITASKTTHSSSPDAVATEPQPAAGEERVQERETEDTAQWDPHSEQNTKGKGVDETHISPAAATHQDNGPHDGPGHEQIADSGQAPEQTAEKTLPTQHTYDDDATAGPSGAETSGRPESLLVSPLTHPNGVDMFPLLSATEQEEMTWEAFTQAEESIIAEDASRSFHDNASDGGYESEGFSSGSTSAESSVRDYMFENGRRYHRFREGAYNFPNDDVEQEREDMKHAMVKLLCGQKLFFSPIGDNPQQILDIGTGTGIWVIESKYPGNRPVFGSTS